MLTFFRLRVRWDSRILEYYRHKRGTPRYHTQYEIPSTNVVTEPFTSGIRMVQLRRLHWVRCGIRCPTCEPARTALVVVGSVLNPQEWYIHS